MDTNPLIQGALPQIYGGIPIALDSNLLVDTGREDWSRVRSPSRAARRRKQGHRQNIEKIYEPDPKVYGIPIASFSPLLRSAGGPEFTYVMHPATFERLKHAIDEHNAGKCSFPLAHNPKPYRPHPEILRGLHPRRDPIVRSDVS